MSTRIASSSPLPPGDHRGPPTAVLHATPHPSNQEGADGAPRARLGRSASSASSSSTARLDGVARLFDRQASPRHATQTFTEGDPMDESVYSSAVMGASALVTFSAMVAAGAAGGLDGSPDMTTSSSLESFENASFQSRRSRRNRGNHDEVLEELLMSVEITAGGDDDGVNHASHNPHANTASNDRDGVQRPDRLPLAGPSRVFLTPMDVDDRGSVLDRAARVRVGYRSVVANAILGRGSSISVFMRSAAVPDAGQELVCARAVAGSSNGEVFGPLPEDYGAKYGTLTFRCYATDEDGVPHVDFNRDVDINVGPSVDLSLRREDSTLVCAYDFVNGFGDIDPSTVSIRLYRLPDNCAETSRAASSSLASSVSSAASYRSQVVSVGHAPVSRFASLGTSSDNDASVSPPPSSRHRSSEDEGEEYDDRSSAAGSHPSRTHNRPTFREHADYLDSVPLPGGGDETGEVRFAAPSAGVFEVRIIVHPGSWLSRLLLTSAASVATAQIVVPVFARVALDADRNHEAVTGSVYCCPPEGSKAAQFAMVTLHHPSHEDLRYEHHIGAPVRVLGGNHVTADTFRVKCECTHADIRSGEACAGMDVVACLWSSDRRLMATSGIFKFLGWHWDGGSL